MGVNGEGLERRDLCWRHVVESLIVVLVCLLLSLAYSLVNSGPTSVRAIIHLRHCHMSSYMWVRVQPCQALAVEPDEFEDYPPDLQSGRVGRYRDMSDPLFQHGYRNHSSQDQRRPIHVGIPSLFPRSTHKKHTGLSSSHPCHAGAYTHPKRLLDTPLMTVVKSPPVKECLNFAHDSLLGRVRVELRPLPASTSPIAAS